MNRKFYSRSEYKLYSDACPKLHCLAILFKYVFSIRHLFVVFNYNPKCKYRLLMCWCKIEVGCAVRRTEGCKTGSVLKLKNVWRKLLDIDVLFPETKGRWNRIHDFFFFLQLLMHLPFKGDTKIDLGKFILMDSVWVSRFANIVKSSLWREIWIAVNLS